MADTRIFKSGGAVVLTKLKKERSTGGSGTISYSPALPVHPRKRMSSNSTFANPCLIRTVFLTQLFLFHIVEHLTTTEAESFLREIYRVLKPSGIVRLSTPDLEDICRAYLNRLEQYDESPSSSNLVKYEWSVLELLDQIARLRCGGLMRDYIRNEHYDPDYARERFGDVFNDFYVPNSKAVERRMPFKEGIYRFAPRRLFGGVLRRISGILDRIFLGDNWDDLETFRRSGELNKWLYDCFSLTLLLRKTGFCDVSRKTYRTSDIPDWNRFDLDRSTYADHPIEPSLYMEAYKPPDSALLQSPSPADIFTQP